MRIMTTIKEIKNYFNESSVNIYKVNDDIELDICLDDLDENVLSNDSLNAFIDFTKSININTVFFEPLMYCKELILYSNIEDILYNDIINILDEKKIKYDKNNAIEFINQYFNEEITKILNEFKLYSIKVNNFFDECKESEELDDGYIWSEITFFVIYNGKTIGITLYNEKVCEIFDIDDYIDKYVLTKMEDLLKHYTIRIRNTTYDFRASYAESLREMDKKRKEESQKLQLAIQEIKNTLTQVEDDKIRLLTNANKRKIFSKQLISNINEKYDEVKKLIPMYEIEEMVLDRYNNIIKNK